MDAEKMGAADLTLKQLTQLMGNCVSCHATWRLTDEGNR
jgi:cytochrome c556